MTERRPATSTPIRLAALSAGWVLLLSPFVDKAFHIDEPLSLPFEPR